MKPAPHQARKRFGQNFLVDQQVIHHIVKAIKPRPDDHLVEIGPGQGALTEQLIDNTARLDVIELDRDLIPILQSKFGNSTQLTIHSADALKFDYKALQKDQKRLRIVGNLPYNISTPLIFHLLAQREIVEDMHFMLQKEVVERMAAKQGSGQYGRLSVMCQYYCNVEALFEVKPHSFKPAPKVDSAIVRLRPHAAMPIIADDPAMLEGVVKTAFQQRRKTLRNALKPLVDDMSCFDALGIDLSLRPENLGLNEFVSLANFLHKNH